MHRPAVLFLDEPTLGLDPVNRQRVWGFLERLAGEEAMTLFLTTHYLEEAEPCDRVVIVDRGRVIAEGTPEGLKRELGGQESIELAVRTPGSVLLDDIAARTGAQPRVSGNVVRHGPGDDAQKRTSRLAPARLRRPDYFLVSSVLVVVVLSVDSAEAVLPRLLPLIGTGIDSLSVRRPTLDDVFIAVTANSRVAP